MSVMDTLETVLKAAVARLTERQLPANANVMVVPEGYEATEFDFERVAPNPRRTRLTTEVDDVASLIEYAKRQAGDHSAFFVDESELTMSLIVDFDDREVPEWREHRAQLTFTKSPQLRRWVEACSARRNQEQFADLISTYRRDINQPEVDKLLDMIVDLRAKSSIEATEVTWKNGQQKVEYAQSASVTNGQGLSMPGSIRIAIPILEGNPKPKFLDLDLDVRLFERKVLFTLRMPDLDPFLKEAFDEQETMFLALKSQTKDLEAIAVYRGTAPAAATPSQP